MEIHYKNKILHKIIDKQFEIIGEAIKFEDIPEEIEIGKTKKRVKWYEFYKFKNEEQYQEWRNWARKSLEEVGMLRDFDKLDMIYGLNYHLIETQKGQLSLAL